VKGKPYAYALSAILIALVIEPSLHREPRDGFPFSHYPMFSSARRAAEAKVAHAVAVTGGGERRPVPPRLVGTDEVLQARATIQQAIDRGTASARELCAALAERVAAGADEESLGPAFAEIEIRTDTYDPIGYFSGDPAPRTSKVHARCRVRP
jgi:hypothetical protein